MFNKKKKEEKNERSETEDFNFGELWKEEDEQNSLLRFIPIVNLIIEVVIIIILIK